MDCKEFNGLIHDFLNDRLNETELSEFLAHIESCDNCRDELRIQYLIYEGLERLGDHYDLGFCHRAVSGPFLSIKRSAAQRKEMTDGE